MNKKIGSPFTGIVNTGQFNVSSSNHLCSSNAYSTHLDEKRKMPGRLSLEMYSLQSPGAPVHMLIPAQWPLLPRTGLFDTGTV